VERRLKQLESGADKQIALASDKGGGWPSVITWRGWPVGRLLAGADVLSPVAAPLESDLLEPLHRDRLARRLQGWLDGQVAAVFAPLQSDLANRGARSDLSGAARGILFQLSENLGCIRRAAVDEQVAALGRAGRKSLKPFGVRIGRHWLYLPQLLKPNAIHWRGLLSGLTIDAATMPPPPSPGRVSVPVRRGVAREFYEAMGYVPFADLAVRCDMVERLASAAWTVSRKGGFTASPELLSLAGCGVDEMTDILAGLGYRVKTDKEGAVTFQWPRNAKPKSKPKANRQSAVSEGSPFAKLQHLTAAH